jgi:predicted RNA-binding Zn ribbon-like protein
MTSGGVAPTGYGRITGKLMMEVTQPVEEGSLRLVREFVNTRDLEAGTEGLRDAEDLAKWLRHNELLGDSRVTGADLSRALSVREAVRELLAGGPAATHASSVLSDAARRSRLRPEFTPSGFRLLSAAGPGADRALGGLLVVIAEAMADGRWRRLKVCHNPACRWAFFDGSRAGAGKWCSMAACGNRHKAAAWRARQRSR